MTTEQERAELLPCPFCGGSPEIVERNVEPQGDPWYGHKYEKFVECECGACLFDETFHEGFYSDEKAVEAWNRRAALQSQDREDAERINFIEANPGWLRVSRLGHRTKQMWACVSPFTNYEYDLFKTAREAIDHARRVGGDGE